MKIRSDIQVSLKSSSASDDLLLDLFLHSNRQNVTQHSSIDEFDAQVDSVLLEHMLFTFYVSAPVFAFRSLMRERMVSYYEKPGVNRVFNGEFYIEKGSDESLAKALELQFNQAYAAYLGLLEDGYSPEASRLILPVSTYADMVVSVSLKQLLDFRSRLETIQSREMKSIIQQMSDIAKSSMPKSFDCMSQPDKVQ